MAQQKLDVETSSQVMQRFHKFSDRPTNIGQDWAMPYINWQIDPLNNLWNFMNPLKSLNSDLFRWVLPRCFMFFPLRHESAAQPAGSGTRVVPPAKAASARCNDCRQKTWRQQQFFGATLNQCESAIFPHITYILYIYVKKYILYIYVYIHIIWIHLKHIVQKTLWYTVISLTSSVDPAG